MNIQPTGQLGARSEVFVEEGTEKGAGFTIYLLPGRWQKLAAARPDFVISHSAIEKSFPALPPFIQKGVR